MTPDLLFRISFYGSSKGCRLALRRMNCTPERDDFTIPGLRRRQFPLRICFAITINKAQGQSIPETLGIDLTAPCFSHGQLYEAPSRTTDHRNVFVCTRNSIRPTPNIVYHEVFDISVYTGLRCTNTQRSDSNEENQNKWNVMAIRNLSNGDRYFPSKISMFLNSDETSKYPPVSNPTSLFEADNGEIPARIS